MGILTRFTDIMKSNINALLDKCEDPAKMIDQTLRDLREDLAEVKKETANIIADAKSADRQVKECEEEITKYTTAAQNALKAGNEDDARTLIAKKQQYESNLVSYKKTQELTGTAIGELLRNYRLNIAKEILISKTGHTLNISEIAYQVGFNDPKYFTRCFTKHFNVPPSKFTGK